MGEVEKSRSRKKQSIEKKQEEEEQRKSNERKTRATPSPPHFPPITPHALASLPPPFQNRQKVSSGKTYKQIKDKRKFIRMPKYFLAHIRIVFQSKQIEENSKRKASERKIRP